MERMFVMVWGFLKILEYALKRIFLIPRILEISHHQRLNQIFALYKIGTYHRIQDLSGLKRTCSWISCCTWICCTKIFYVRRSEKTGIVPVSGTDDVIVEDGQPAGHAVCAVGYDDDKQTVIIRNSWGEDWGDKGYCYFPYELFKMELCKICGQVVN